MNKLLFSQLYLAAHTQRDVEDDSGKVIIQKTFNPEKFAELVLQECVDHLGRDEHSVPLTERKGRREAAIAIKQHFGVVTPE